MARSSAYRDKRQWKQETLIVDLERFRTDSEFRADVLKEARAAAQFSPPRHVQVIAREGRRKHKLFEIWNHMNPDGTSPYDPK